MTDPVLHQISHQGGEAVREHLRQCVYEGTWLSATQDPVLHVQDFISIPINRLVGNIMLTLDQRPNVGLVYHEARVFVTRWHFQGFNGEAL